MVQSFTTRFVFALLLHLLVPGLRAARPVANQVALEQERQAVAEERSKLQGIAESLLRQQELLAAQRREFAKEKENHELERRLWNQTLHAHVSGHRAYLDELMKSCTQTDGRGVLEDARQIHLQNVKKHWEDYASVQAKNGWILRWKDCHFSVHNCLQFLSYWLAIADGRQKAATCEVRERVPGVSRRHTLQHSDQEMEGRISILTEELENAKKKKLASAPVKENTVSMVQNNIDVASSPPIGGLKPKQSKKTSSSPDSDVLPVSEDFAKGTGTNNKTSGSTDTTELTKPKPVEKPTSSGSMTKSDHVDTAPTQGDTEDLPDTWAVKELKPEDVGIDFASLEQDVTRAGIDVATLTSELDHLKAVRSTLLADIAGDKNRTLELQNAEKCVLKAELLVTGEENLPKDRSLDSLVTSIRGIPPIPSSGGDE